MRTMATVCLLLVVLTSDSSAQPSMRLTALANGGVATNTVDSMEPNLSLQQLIDRSDLIVHGRISSKTAVLFMDDRFVGTDYGVVPHRVLKQNPALNIRARPGLPPSAALVRVLGGTLVEGSSRFTTVNSALPEAEAPRSGDEVIWFLRYDSELQVYTLVGGSFGAVRIDAGHVLSQTAETAKRRGGQPAPVSTFLHDVQQRIDAKR